MEKLFDDLPDANYHDKRSQIKPFLKWAGGKFKLLDEIKSRLPKDGKRFIEPFLGGGSVSLNSDFKNIVASDVNEDLISVYVALRDLEGVFIKKCESLFSQEIGNGEIYYQMRNKFNTTQDKIEKAAIFVYLNKHCYNGLCRYNSKGGFNTPIGAIKMAICPSKEMENAISKLKKIEFVTRGFEAALKEATEGDVVYCDPPYLPITIQSFVQYSENGFGIEKQIELARLSREAANRGAFVLVSNHDTTYARDLYEKEYGAKIENINVNRLIGGINAKRGKVKELFATFERK